MPAFTVNRNYPYPLPTDPADVPQALQDLAEAIDDDVCAFRDSVGNRPVARFTGTGPFASPSPTHPVNSPPTPYEDRIPFDTEMFNTANITMMSPSVGYRLIWPQDPGFYFAVVTVSVPQLTLAATTDYLGLQVRRGDGTNPTSLIPAPRLAGTSNPVGSGPQGRILSLGVGAFMNGTTDAFSVEFRAATNPAVSQYVIGDRSITILKMTES
jgi:hypothetical protein